MGIKPSMSEDTQFKIMMWIYPLTLATLCFGTLSFIVWCFGQHPLDRGPILGLNMIITIIVLIAGFRASLDLSHERKKNG